MATSLYPTQVAGPAGRQHELMRAMGDANKSLTVGNPYVQGQQGTGAAYVHEQLDDFIVSLQEDDSELKLLKQLYKQPCPGPVFKYDQILSWGHTSVDARFQREIARPRPDSAVVRQVNEAVVYMGILGQVSYPALMTDMNVDPEVQEIRTQTMQLLRSIETALYTGDSARNPLMFDGYRTRILKQSPRGNIINCEGRPLTLDQVDEALAIIKDKPNYGRPNAIHLNYKAHARFNREYVPQARFDLEGGGGSRSMNLAFDRFRNVVGDVELVGTSFIDAGSRGAVDPYQIGQVSPVSPTITNVAVSDPGPGVRSYFTPATAGSYFVYVQAVNADGSSPLVLVGNGAQNIAAGKVLTGTLQAAQGANTDYFVIYATKQGEAPVIDQGQIVDANAWEVGTVPNVVGQQGGNAPVPFVFNNFKMPGTTEGYVFDTRMETMFWVNQMALGKIDLATTQSSKDFMLQIYGTCALRAPGRVAMFINIGA